MRNHKSLHDSDLITFDYVWLDFRENKLYVENGRIQNMGRGPWTWIISNLQKEIAPVNMKI